MRTLSVVFLSPGFNLVSGIGQIHEPVRVQAFIPESSVEAFHVTVLHRPAGLNVHQCDALSSHQPEDVPAGELRPVVAAQVPGVPRSRITRSMPCHLPAGDTSVDFDRRGLSRVAVHQGQRTQRAPSCQRIGNEVQRPFLVRPDEQRVHRHRSLAGAFASAAAPSAFGSVQPMDASYAPPPSPVRSVDPQPPVAEARLLPRQCHQRLAQLRVAVRPRLIPVCRAVHFQELASMALARPDAPPSPAPRPASRSQAPSVFSDHRRQRLFVQTQIGHHFLQRRFSSSSARSRFASLTSMPPYFDFQLYSV